MLQGSSAVGPWIGGSSRLVVLVGLGKLEKATTDELRTKSLRVRMQMQLSI